jgi:hypothetical protein
MDETNSMNERMGNQAEKLKGKAAGVAQAAKDRARTEVETRKGTAAGTIDQLANAVDTARNDLSGSPTLSQYAGELSGSMHALAERLRSRSIDDIASDVRRIARSNPTVFIAGSIAIGLLGARFLKATTQREDEGSGRDMNGDFHPDDAGNGEYLAGGSVPTASATSGIGTAGSGGAPPAQTNVDYQSDADSQTQDVH